MLRARLFRVAPAPHDDVLVVQVETSVPAAFDVVIVGSGMEDQEPFEVVASVAAGDPLVLPVDILGKVGPFDIFVQGTSTQANATIKLGVLDIPNTMVKGTVADARLASNGGLDFSRITSGFGDLTGGQFVELTRKVSDPPQATTITADGQMGARLPAGPVPVLAHYVQVGPTLHLESIAVANESNMATIAYDQTLTTQTLHSIVGFNASITGGGQVAYSLESEPLQYIGIQMVPDPLRAVASCLRNPRPNPISSCLRRATYNWRLSWTATCGRRSCRSTSCIQRLIRL